MELFTTLMEAFKKPSNPSLTNSPENNTKEWPRIKFEEGEYSVNSIKKAYDSEGVLAGYNFEASGTSTKGKDLFGTALIEKFTISKKSQALDERRKTPKLIINADSSINPALYV